MTMQMLSGGSVDVDGYLARRTSEGRWLVSRKGAVVGYVDLLAEVSGLIDQHREKVRAHLADIARRMAERKARDENERAMVASATKRD